MRITTTNKILGAVAVAGVVAATGSAFTGTGLSSGLDANQYIGGTVSQTVSGATLSSVEYHFTDATNTALDQVTLHLLDANGKAPTITLAGVSGGGGFVCGQVALGSSTCSGTGVIGVTGIAVTV